MSILVLILVAVAFLIAWPACGLVRGWSLRAGALDTEAVPGQVKAARRAVPNTGGIGIAAAVFGPLIAGLLALEFVTEGMLPGWAAAAGEHLEGLRSVRGMGWAVVAGGLWLHGLGVIDDRRPLGPMVKLACMAAPPLVLAVFFDTRLLTLLDGYASGSWLSVLVTLVWFLAVTNAMNFMDNMDGLCAGVAATAGAMFLAATLIGGQWFVAGVLALLVGACGGFLVWNRPPARMFMGDGGSLVIGFLLAFATTRTTYIGDGVTAWYAVLMPVVVLAVPLYDMASVTTIRLSQGRSPFVGDLQHFSHRLVRRGLSTRSAVAVIVGLTGATGISGLLLTRAEPWQAFAIAAQVGLLLAVLGLFEHRAERAANRNGGGVAG
ncbi:MAG: undecaprenyl/decaprenyl-phosphate alpha-N-acetylglucosaminyl 1-phosphate transferase [Planctomycetes bacterium]|nr:undecaprenyl/decaprenyl-phosphate alpha-N-acetylglucosaminyl 1-phosphate transferase [Planctomycetota bacterium]